jgi:hypothetical protein
MRYGRANTDAVPFDVDPAADWGSSDGVPARRDEVDGAGDGGGRVSLKLLADGGRPPEDTGFGMGC